MTWNSTVTTLDGEAAGSVELSDAIFGLEPRADILQRCVVWQLAKRRAGTHKVKSRAEIWRTGKKMYEQKGTGGARHGSARAPQFRGGGRSFGPVVRSHAIDLPKKVRALALRHALSAKAKDGGIIVARHGGGRRTPRPRRSRAHFGKLGLANALIIDGAEVDANFALAARNIPNIDVLPVQGINVYDILRRDKLVLTKAARRCAGGALQMSTKDPRHYDVILSPVITEKATIASEQQPGGLQGRAQRDQAADQGSGREAVRRQGEDRQHPGPQGQDEGFPRPLRRAAGRQESDRDPRRGSPHRRDHGPVRG